MAFKSLRIRPGLNAQLTPLLLETGWFLGGVAGSNFSSNLMRFPAEANGQPQPIGGWAQLATFSGKPRGVLSWTTLPGTITPAVVTPLLGVGTSTKLYIYDYTTLHDISPVALPALDTAWALDSWGEDLMAVRRGSPVYNWKASLGYFTLAAALVGGPPACNGCLVATPQQQLIVWGAPVQANSSAWGAGVQDPMLINWSDNSLCTPYSAWFPTVTNAAGSYRLTQGSQIMQILPGHGQMPVLTDAALYGMQYIGAPFIYGFQQLGTNCGSIGPRAATTVGSQLYWWSSNGQFYVYDGVVRALPCPIRDFCLDAVTPGSAAALSVSASTNSQYSEIRWDFPFNNPGSTACDSYVSYNVLNGTWAFGTSNFPGCLVSIGRNAMTDFVPTVGFPIGLDNGGKMWRMEGVSPEETPLVGAPTALPWTLMSGYADLSEGEDFTFVDWILPDASQSATAGRVNLRVLTTDYPDAVAAVSGPYAFETTTQNIPLRARGRQIAVAFANLDNKQFWRLGRTRLRIASDGRR